MDIVVVIAKKGIAIRRRVCRSVAEKSVKSFLSAIEVILIGKDSTADYTDFVVLDAVVIDENA